MPNEPEDDGGELLRMEGLPKTYTMGLTEVIVLNNVDSVAQDGRIHRHSRPVGLRQIDLPQLYRLRAEVVLVDPMAATKSSALGIEEQRTGVAPDDTIIIHPGNNVLDDRSVTPWR